MDKQEIIEGNKIIANFDSRLMLDESDPKKETWDLVDPKDGGWLHVSHLKYHEDWNQLMPVVEKIGNISIDYYQENNLPAYEECGKVLSTHIVVSIETVWNKVVQFIQWYNSQKQ